MASLPAPARRENAGREGTVGREQSSGWGRAAWEGELLAGAAARWRRAADLLCEAPAKFKVMRWRVVQRSRRPLGPHRLSCRGPHPARPTACPAQPSNPASQTTLIYPRRGFQTRPGKSSGGLGSAAGASGGARPARAGRRGAVGASRESEDLPKVAFKERPHCFSQTILSRWEN